MRWSIVTLWVVVGLALGCAQKQGDQTGTEGKAPAAAPGEAAKPAEAGKPAEQPAAGAEAGKPAEQPAAEAEAGKPAEQPAAEAEAGEESVPGVPELKVATYEIPNLTMDLAKQLTLALSENEGVVAAKSDEAAGLFMVTYSAGCPYGILSALQGVVPEAKLKGVATREGGAPVQSGCGGCPKKDTCGGTH